MVLGSARTPGMLAALAGAGARSGGGLEQAELSQRGHAVVNADLLRDLAVDDLQHRRAGEAHLAAGRRGKAPDQKVIEGRTGVGSAAFPLADHSVALGDQIGRTQKLRSGNAARKSVMNA